MLAASVAAGAAVDEARFRWERTLEAPPSALAAFQPDGPLYAHSRLELADLRVLDAVGRQVPWRRLPDPAPRSSKQVELLNAGVQGRAFVGLLDLGPRRVVRNRAELEIPNERDYVGRVTVFGSDDRRTFTRLSTTTVYDLRGASAASSTTLVFPPTDHRFLRLRGVGVPLPFAARVYNAPRRPAVDPVRARLTTAERDRTTVVTLDVGHAKRPVDLLRFATSTARFDRSLEIAGSNGRRFAYLQAGRIVRLGGVTQLDVPVATRHRRIQVTIHNADDEPLRGLTVQPLARRRTIVLSEGFSPPYRLLYGNPGLEAPEYDFAQLPARELRPLAAGRLGPERQNPDWERPEDDRSFLDRNPRVVELGLALVAVGLGIGGFFALRRRA